MALILPNFNLQHLNTLASNVNAMGYVSVSTQEELIEALLLAEEKNWPILPLGGGSNIILRDDFPGLVIHLCSKGETLVREDENHFYVKAAAGVNWHEFVCSMLSQHVWGLENLSLIPGTVGAAPIQNIGAYGVELDSVFYELTALDIKSKLPVIFTRDACGFKYRDSIFKQRLKDQYIILDVTFKLNKTPTATLKYPALKEYISTLQAKEITPEVVSHAVCQLRASKLPDPAVIPNVGSFFKNPIVTQVLLKSIQKVHPAVVHYPVDDKHVKLAAAWLIDKAGWRGFSENGVAVHENQALVLTNPGQQKASLLLELAQKIQASVDKRYGVLLELEPRIYP